MSLLDSLRQIRFKQNSIKYHADRIETNMKNAIDAVIEKGKYTATGEETIDDLPSLIDGIETTRRYPNGTAWTTCAKNCACTCLEKYGDIWIAGSAEAGTAMYSTDGKNWSNVVFDESDNSSNATKILWYIKYANCSWIATNVILNPDVPSVAYSDDGITWSYSSLLSDTVDSTEECVIDIVYGNGRWLLVTTHKLYYSDDMGRTWNPCDTSNLSTFSLSVYCSGSSNYYYINTISGNPGVEDLKLFIFNNNRWIGTNFNTLIYSDDGIIWHKCNMLSTDGVTAITNAGYITTSTICYGNGIYVVGCTRGLFYSEDGITWIATGIAANAAQYFHKIRYENNRWIFANGYYANIYYSDDGINWNSTSADTGLRSNAALTYFNNTWFINGVNGLCYSTDGITWTLMSSSPFVVIGYNSGMYICADTSNYTLAYTTDLVNFTSLGVYTTNAIIYAVMRAYPRILYKNGIWIITIQETLAYSVCWEI